MNLSLSYAPSPRSRLALAQCPFRRLILFLALVLVPLSAHAEPCPYVGKDHATLHPTFRSIGLTLCSKHFGAGTPANAGVVYVIKAFNAVQDSTVSFHIAGYDDHKDYDGTLAADGFNRIDLTKPQPTASGDASFSGRTRARASGGGITEFDIVFNRRSNWDYGMPSSWGFSDGTSWFRAVMLHEVGHGLGFGHNASSTSALSVMGGMTGRWISNKKPGLKAHDRGHIRFHYGRRTLGLADLALSNYTTEQKKTGGLWKCILTEGISRDRVRRGFSLTVSWTRFNLGPREVGYKTRIYLSRDVRLDCHDVLLRSFHEDATSDSTVHRRRQVTVPANVATGKYHLLISVSVDGQDADPSNDVMPIHKTLVVTRRIDVVGGLIKIGELFSKKN